MEVSAGLGQGEEREGRLRVGSWFQGKKAKKSLKYEARLKGLEMIRRADTAKKASWGRRGYQRKGSVSDGLVNLLKNPLNRLKSQKKQQQKGTGGFTPPPSAAHPK